MATNALSMLIAAETNAQLNNVQAGIIAGLQKTGNSFKFKSQNANLSQKAGSYEFKRFTNASSATYGTARAAGSGTALTAPATVVQLDTHKEIVEEVAAFDAERFGLDASVLSIVNARKANHQMTMAYDLESDFWRLAYNAAIANGHVILGVASASTTPEADIETGIVALETVQNSYVRGVPRTMIGGVLRPGTYSLLKSRLNTLHNINFAVQDEELQGINGVPLFSELFLPKKVDGIVMAKESIAQPVDVRPYGGERIPLSDDVAIELFYHYGTKPLAPELVYAMITPDGTHTAVSVVATLPAANQSTTTFYVLSAATTDYAKGDILTYASGAWTKYNA